MTYKIKENPYPISSEFYSSGSAPFSVLMSIYLNTNADYFHRAMKSVWDDQILKPAEIVVVLDGPIKVSVQQVVLFWKQKLGSKFIELVIPQNSGLSNALNVGLTKCSYDIVARMDDDDISLPSRFLKQYIYMIQHEDLAVLGGQIQERNDDLTEILSNKVLPLSGEEIINFSKWRCPLNHPTVFFRKKIIQNIGGYPNIYPEDFPLWGKLIKFGYKIENLPDILLVMRQEEASLSRRGYKFFKGEVKGLRYLYEIGQISSLQLIIGVTIRFLIRLSPRCVKQMINRALK